MQQYQHRHSGNYIPLINQGTVAKVLVVGQNFYNSKNGEESRFEELCTAMKENFGQFTSQTKPKRFRPITHMYLESCLMSEDQLWELVRVLHMSKAFLKKLSLGGLHIYENRLVANSSNSSPIDNLVHLLAEFANLTLLKLGGSLMRPETVRVLAGKLLKMPKVETLSLLGSTISDEGCEHLLGIIGKHPRLRSIELDATRVSARAFERIQRKLKHASSASLQSVLVLLSVSALPRLRSNCGIKRLPKELIRCLAGMLLELPTHLY